MAFNFADLLHGINSIVGEDPDAGGADPTEVDGVTATLPSSRFKQLPNTPGPVAPDMGNVRQVQQAQSANSDTQGASQHKGMFGLHGTLRDVLGTLGDAFLVQGGGKAEYQPFRQNEKVSDAGQGFTQDPLGAIERVNQLDPAAAQRMYQSYQTDQLKNETLKSNQINQQSQQESRRNQAQQRLANTLGGLLNTGSRSPQAYAIAMSMAKKLAAKQNFDLLKDFGIDPDASYDQTTAQIQGGLGRSSRQTDSSAQGQERIDNQASQFDQRLPIEKQNADSRTVSANKRPNAPNPTAASLAAPIIKKAQGGETLTPQDEETLTRLGYSKTRGQGKKSSALSGLPPPPAAGGGKGGFVIRNGKLVPK